MKSLYFIAIIPPEEICDEITDFKKDFAERFESIKALRTIPHITLLPPISLDENTAKLFVENFINLPLNSEIFTIEIKDFSCFNNKKNPVIFVKPIENPALKNLQKIVFETLKTDGLEYRFHPHFTIAYRDLTSENFEKAWQEYQTKKYEAIFSIEKIYLLKHNGKSWDVFAEKSISNS